MRGETLTMSEAAAVARVTVGNLRGWIKAGWLKAAKPDGRHWAIRVDDLMQALVENPARGGRGMRRTDGDRANPRYGDSRKQSFNVR